MALEFETARTIMDARGHSLSPDDLMAIAKEAAERDCIITARHSLGGTRGTIEIRITYHPEPPKAAWPVIDGRSSG